VEIIDGSLQTDPSGDPLDDLGDGRRSRGAIERSAAVVASRTSERTVDVASVVIPEHRHGLPALSIVMRSEIHDEPTDKVGGRHLLPPRTTVVESERHGVLDAADGKMRKDLYVTLGERDAFTFESIGVPDPDDSTDDEGTSRYSAQNVSIAALSNASQVDPSDKLTSALPAANAKSSDV
jgi:hypothetical protein